MFESGLPFLRGFLYNLGEHLRDGILGRKAGATGRNP